MTDPIPAPPGADDRAESAIERKQLTYEGYALPLYITLLWLAFLLFGLIYFVRQL
jgi:hypothetical protein